MDEKTLRRVQLTQLDIAREIQRICVKHNIGFFVDSGSLLGAVRHKGFIPWDDDMDLGMLREDYDRFMHIAPEELKSEYFLQTVESDPYYGLFYAKVRKNGTMLDEEKGPKKAKQGIWVDIFPYDFASSNEKERDYFAKKRMHYQRMMFMKCGYTPWKERGKINIKTRIYFIPYQIMSIFMKKEKIIKQYNSWRGIHKDTEEFYAHWGILSKDYFPVLWFKPYRYFEFEDIILPGIKEAEKWLTKVYGDYMKLPPEEERGDMHNILEVDFGE